jgi:ERCC4-type nuclease
MNPYEVKKALENLVLLVDTREQDTKLFRKRLALVGLPFVRDKLDFGDYSVKTKTEDGVEHSLKNRVCIERKMSLDELCNCYCKGRGRFSREFERAKACGAKLYLLVEDANWENVINHKYRSKMHPQAFLASLTAWLARYDCQLIFCKAETTSALIKEILYREMKEYLECVEDETK